MNRPSRPAGRVEAAGGFPPGFAVVLDPGVRRLRSVDGTPVVVGGSPLRLLELTAAGGVMLEELARGAPVPTGAAAARMVRRLLDGGLAHPRPTGPSTPRAYAAVVPVRDDADALARLVAAGALRHAAEVVVVDDGSRDPRRIREACAPLGDRVRIVRLDEPAGPAAARNSGADASVAPFVAFVDADCRPDDGWDDLLLAHFDDAAVAAAAPRIRATGQGGGRWSRLAACYEAERSPLDLGPLEGPVRPRSRIPYVPTAALVVRRAALRSVGGFDAGLHVGEDVDLVWRLVEGGWTVRYVPSAAASHDVRATPAAWLAQRFRYGTSAAPLAKRHRGALTPVAVSGWSAAAWAAAAGGWPTPAAGLATGTALAAGTTAALVPKLRRLEHPWREAIRLAGFGHLAAGRLLGGAVRRAWWPLLAAAAPTWRPARRILVSAVVADPLVQWALGRLARRRGGPGGAARGLGPVLSTVLRVADDVAYGVGVWVGCGRERTVAPLLPDFTNWPGRRRAVDRQ